MVHLCHAIPPGLVQGGTPYFRGLNVWTTAAQSVLSIESNILQVVSNIVARQEPKDDQGDPAPNVISR